MAPALLEAAGAGEQAVVGTACRSSAAAVDGGAGEAADLAGGAGEGGPAGAVGALCGRRAACGVLGAGSGAARVADGHGRCGMAGRGAVEAVHGQRPVGKRRPAGCAGQAVRTAGVGFTVVGVGRRPARGAAVRWCVVIAVPPFVSGRASLTPWSGAISPAGRFGPRDARPRRGPSPQSSQTPANAVVKAPGADPLRRSPVQRRAGVHRVTRLAWLVGGSGRRPTAGGGGSAVGRRR